MKMKKLFILLALAAVLGSTVAEARRGWGGRGFHRSFRHHGGWRGRGWGGGLWGPGYGWGFGPSFGVTVPVGGDSGPSRSSALKYAMKRYNNSGTAKPFCSWVYDSYEAGTARSLCNQYNAYMSGAGSTSSSPSGYVSFGLGGGYGGYGYPGWRGGWW